MALPIFNLDSLQKLFYTQWPVTFNNIYIIIVILTLKPLNDLNVTEKKIKVVKFKI